MNLDELRAVGQAHCGSCENCAVHNFLERGNYNGECRAIIALASLVVRTVESLGNVLDNSTPNRDWMSEAVHKEAHALLSEIEFEMTPHEVNDEDDREADEE